jgi:hypothetical protein
MQMRGGFAAVAAVLAGVLPTASAHAAPDVSQFSVTPSTTQAGGHPNLQISTSFSSPSSGVKDFALHLPAGLSATPTAIPYCTRKRLLADICSPRSVAGSITAVGEAYGFDVPVSRKIYNVRPVASERVRLAVPILGSLSRPGIAAELPVTERPADKGLDMVVSGLPQQVNGLPIRVKRLSIRLRGTVRTRVRKRLRTKAFLTNPRTCTPATSVLEVTTHEAPTATITKTSAFTPTGCSDGAKAASTRQLVPPPLELERLPPGALPGTQIRGDFKVPGLGAVRYARRLVVTGTGRRRAAMLIARGGRRELCFAAVVGARVRRASFTCLERWDRPPLLLRAAVGGRSRKVTQWMALVGLARREVKHVAVESQVGVVSHPRLHAWRGFPWKAYATPPAFRYRLPSDVRAKTTSRTVVQSIDLGWAYGAACGEQGARPCTRRDRAAGSWSAVRDPITRSATPFIKRTGGSQAKSLAFDHPIVRQLVAGQAFSLDTVVEWSTCKRRLIGAIVQIRLTEPVNFEGDVPVYGNDESHRSAYLEGIAHLRVERAVFFDIYVDLNRAKVVSISLGATLPHTGVPEPKVDFKLIGELRPAGGPGSGSCE